MSRQEDVVAEGATIRLANRAAAVRSDALGGEAREALKRAVLDWTACTVAGASGAEAARKGLLRTDEGGNCTVLGTDDRCSAPVAAFLNAYACHVLEFDDLHGPSIYHPGAPTIAAALAVAQRDGASRSAFAEGVVAGYEVGIRLGEAAGTEHYARFHTTGTVGAIGAAVAAARVMGLSGEQIADAIGIAATQAAGLWSFTDDAAPTKPVHPAHAAMAGVVAASLAAGGLRGARLAIEGPKGFLATLGGDPRAACLTEGLDGDGNRIEALTLKAYPCCGHTHTGIDGARAIHARLTASGGSAIATVSIDTYSSALAVAGIMEPKTPDQAAFSYPHIIAWALLRGSVDGAFTQAALADPEILALRARITVRADKSLDPDYPDSQPARIQVECADGTRHEAFERYAAGSPHKPMSQAELDAKLALLLGDEATSWRAFALGLCEPGDGPLAHDRERTLAWAL